MTIWWMWAMVIINIFHRRLRYRFRNDEKKCDNKNEPMNATMQKYKIVEERGSVFPHCWRETVLQTMETPILLSCPQEKQCTRHKSRRWRWWILIDEKAMRWQCPEVLHYLECWSDGEGNTMWENTSSGRCDRIQLELPAMQQKNV